MPGICIQKHPKNVHQSSSTSNAASSTLHYPKRGHSLSNWGVVTPQPQKVRPRPHKGKYNHESPTGVSATVPALWKWGLFSIYWGLQMSSGGWGRWQVDWAWEKAGTVAKSYASFWGNPPDTELHKSWHINKETYSGQLYSSPEETDSYSGSVE